MCQGFSLHGKKHIFTNGKNTRVQQLRILMSTCQVREVEVLWLPLKVL